MFHNPSDQRPTNIQRMPKLTDPATLKEVRFSTDQPYHKLYEILSATPDIAGLERRSLSLYMADSGVNYTQDSLVSFPLNGYVAVVVRIDTSSLVNQLMGLFRLPFSIRMIANMMDQANIDPVGRYGVYPSAENPFVVYSLDSTAARYAEANIFPDNPTGGKKVIYKLIAKWTGCYPGVEGVVLLGVAR